MKKTLIHLFAAMLLGTGAVSANNLVESNVTISLKFYYNESEVPQDAGNFLINSYKTFTVKNANFIAAIQAANAGNEDYDFAPNAKILRQDFFDTDGDRVDTIFLIRDKNGKEADVTDFFDVDLDEAVQKIKLAKATGLGSVSLIATDFFEFNANPELLGADSAEGAGVSRYNFKIVKVKGKDETVEVLTYSSKLGGRALFNVPTLKRGIIEGSIKISGGKVIAGQAGQPG